MIDFGNGIVAGGSANDPIRIKEGHSGLDYPDFEQGVTEFAIQDGGDLGASRANARRMAVPLDFGNSGMTRAQIAASWLPGKWYTLSTARGSIEYKLAAPVVFQSGNLTFPSDVLVPMVCAKAYPETDAQSASITAETVVDSRSEVQCPLRVVAVFAGSSDRLLINTPAGVTRIDDTFVAGSTVVVDTTNHSISISGAETVGAEFTTAATTRELGEGYYQTFPVVAGTHRGITTKLKNLQASPRSVIVRLHNGTSPTAAVIASQTINLPASYDAEIRASWSAAVTAGTKCWSVQSADAGDNSQILVYTGAGYADGVGGVRYTPDVDIAAWVAGHFSTSATEIIGQTSTNAEKGDSGFNDWQSFTLSSPAVVTALGLNIKTPTSGDYLLTLQTSNGTAIAGDENVRAWTVQNVSSTRAMITKNLERGTSQGGGARPIVLPAGQYRIEIQSSSGDNRYGYSTANPYAGGQLSTNSTHDAAFRVVGRAITATDVYFRSHVLTGAKNGLPNFDITTKWPVIGERESTVSVKSQAGADVPATLEWTPKIVGLL